MNICTHILSLSSWSMQNSSLETNTFIWSWLPLSFNVFKTIFYLRSFPSVGLGLRLILPPEKPQSSPVIGIRYRDKEKSNRGKTLISYLPLLFPGACDMEITQIWANREKQRIKTIDTDKCYLMGKSSVAVVANELWLPKTPTGFHPHVNPCISNESPLVISSAKRQLSMHIFLGETRHPCFWKRRNNLRLCPWRWEWKGFMLQIQEKKSVLLLQCHSAGMCCPIQEPLLM